MSQPQPYTRLSNFQTYQQNNPAAPYVGSAHDAEFNAIATTLSETLANLALIQRDDGELTNGIVTVDTLDVGVFSLMGDWTPRGAWVTATNYSIGDIVTPAGNTVTYVAVVANTSGATFAGDLALGYWQPINGSGAGGTAATFTFSTNNVILGRATAGAGAGEEIACTAAARSVLDDATTADMRVTLGLGATSDPTFSDVIVDTLTVNGFTAKSFVYSNASKVLTTTAAPTNGQLLIGSTGAIPALASLTGTSNQVVVTPGAGSITLSLPQDIGTGSAPTFSGLLITSLSQGAVVFIGASSALSQDLTNFVWDDANNRLGIGTNAPTVPLHVKGGTAGNVALLVENSASLQKAVVGIPLGLFITNTDNTDANSAAKIQLSVGGATANDPFILFNISGVSDWSLGVDNSDSDKFKISGTGQLGSLDYLVIASGGAVTMPGTSLGLSGFFSLAKYMLNPVVRTITNATDSPSDTDYSLICNRAGTVTLTLPTASSYTGRTLRVRTITANTVVSNASNVVPLIGGAAGTAILAATAGKWAVLESDGTNWQISASN